MRREETLQWQPSSSNESAMLRSLDVLGKSVLLPEEKSTVEVSTILKSQEILQSPPRSAKIG
jgi:hypothetical protein